jgi:Nitrate/nitrite transporter
VIVAVVMRPVGGWFSDRVGPIPVLTVVYAVLTAGAIVQSFTADLRPLGTIAFLSMAAALGAGSGATFALVGKVAPASKVGSVTGLVGAAGGLGGFIPPLVMGYIYGRTGSYGWGLALLAMVAAGTMIFTMTVVRSAALGRAAAEAGGLPNTPSRQRQHRARPGV